MARPALGTEETPKLSFIFTEDSFRIDQPELSLSPEEEKQKELFREDKYNALFQLAFEERKSGESPSLTFLRALSESFLRCLMKAPGLELSRGDTLVELDEEEGDKLIMSVPFVLGAEYISRAWLALLFSRLNQVFSREIRNYEGTVETFFAEKSQHLRIPERIFFHLVENRADDGMPFAFLATYATKDDNGRVRHMPLSYALVEYKNERDKLLGLLSCLNGAAEASPLISSFVESGEMFHPLKMSAAEAYEFLQAVPAIEEAGILCRVPVWWKRRASNIGVEVSLGEDRPSILSFDGLISMRPRLVVDGVELTEKEIERLLQQTEGLTLIKGRWVEVNHARLQALLEECRKNEGEVTLLQALRMETGLADAGQKEEEDNGVIVTNGRWLSGLLQQLRRPQTLKDREVPDTVQAVLRPYQQTGFAWLRYMSSIGFGACLADDMGLGKTLQVLTFLEKVRQTEPDAQVLLIVPASLLGNWEREAEKFTPDLEVRILHGGGAKSLNEQVESGDCFLNITTYSMAGRLTSLQERLWNYLILDEAQAIKNPSSKQTRSIKKLQAVHRIAMTGTPIENDLSNLWSLFDFLNKGLLGSREEFAAFVRELPTHQEGYQKLKNMVSPFILRRLKTDRTIIADLPDKMEQIDYVQLSKKQVVLYRDLIREMEDVLNDRLSGMQRRGVVLAAIQKFKQICNHPDQYLGQDTFDPEESGKFQTLAEICRTIYEKRERVLVFTQYAEITEQLSKYLETVFRQKGLVITGRTPVKRRQKLVELFNGEEYVPYMVLSVKAAGTGLNLVAANHVIHFDRWWNPAVENQATDRAFRIGQKKNVIVHKLVSEGTIEEKIDQLINSKKELAENVIGGSGENWITEMDDAALLNLMKLEI